MLNKYIKIGNPRKAGISKSKAESTNQKTNKTRERNKKRRREKERNNEMPVVKQRKMSRFKVSK